MSNQPEVPTKRDMKRLRGKGPIPGTLGRVFKSTAPDIDPSEVVAAPVAKAKPKAKKKSGKK